MSNLPEIPASLIPALRIFEDEMRSHLQFFSTLDREALERGVQDDAFRENLMHRFHTIKGGAGFFGLERITQSSGKAERMLQHPEKVTREELIQTVINSTAELSEAFQDVATLTGSTP